VLRNDSSNDNQKSQDVSAKIELKKKEPRNIFGSIEELFKSTPKTRIS